MKNKENKFIYKLGSILVLVIILVVFGWSYFKHSTDVDSGATKKEKSVQYEKTTYKSSLICSLYSRQLK